VDALLRGTTMSPLANVQATPLLDLAPASQPAPSPTLAPSPVWALDPIPAPDPTPATGSTPAPPPTPSQLPACAHRRMPAPHPCHPLFLNARNQVNDCATATTAQPPWNLYQGMPMQSPWNLYQGTRFDPSVTDGGTFTVWHTRTMFPWKPSGGRCL
jgi:hypothetical protein